MAIIKIGPPASAIRGSVGSLLFSENLSSTFVGLNRSRSNPRSPKQQTERAYLATIPALWSALTESQRDDWRTFAAHVDQELENALGEAYYTSGYAWFVKCNLRLLRMALATISASPTQARPAAPVIDDFRVCVAGTESDLCTCGVASASTEDLPDHPASNAFDNNLANQWRTAFGTTTGWIRYDLCDPANVKHYAFYTVNPALYSPKDWDFQVWTAGAWETIHSVTDMVVGTLVWNHFYCPNPYTETDYRMNVTANNGNPDNLRMFEIQFFAGDEGASVICYPENEFDNAPDYDLVLHVSQGRSEGVGSKSQGFLEILVDPDPGRWFALCQEELEAAFGVIQQNRSWFARFYRQTSEGLRSAADVARTVTIS
jgi:hypothetical protein